MSTKTVKATTIAWLVDSSWRANEFAEAIKSGDEGKMVGCLAFSSNEGMGTGSTAWTRIGSAEITVEVVKEDEIVTNMVAALRHQQQAVRADAEVKANGIERQIQQLLAITNEPSS